MYHFQSNKKIQETLISKAQLKSLYSRLGFKVIKDLETSPNFKVSCKRYHYESGKSKELQKKIDLQCYQNIPRRVTIIHDNQIDFNENGNVLKNIN